MSMNKKAKKNLIIASVTMVLVAGFALGLWFFVQYQSDRKTVEVLSVSNPSVSTTYWGDQTYTSGTAASDSTQEIYPSDKQTVSEIYVTEGQQVSVGDPLIQYDKTLLELDVESKDIAVKQAEIELDNAEDQLKKLQATKPSSTPKPTATPAPTKRPSTTPTPAPPPTPPRTPTPAPTAR
ncbi:MAG: biotin/lipoyl-binding protein, partial [Acutalibacter sp.]